MELDASSSSTAPRKWTDAQLAAITTVGHSLLVSAAAGSGKTSVLAERCVHLLCDAAEPCEVHELLVVTFTEAAAAEMKDRVARSLAARHTKAATDQTSRHLAMLDRASIGTLHAFCARLLRQHFHLKGLDPDFRILDADEASLLKLEVAREMFRDRYDADDDAFRRLVDAYGSGDDERLVEQVLRIHETLASVVDPAGWIGAARQRLLDASTLPLDESDLGRTYIDAVRAQLAGVQRECAAAGQSLKRTGTFPAYVEHLRELYQILNHWVRVLGTHGVDALAEEVQLEMPKLPRMSNALPGKESAKDQVDAVREAMSKGAWRQGLRFSAAQWAEGLQQTMPHADVLLSLVAEFGDRYREAKGADGGLDFADLERVTLEMLGVDRPSAVARMYHGQLKHVLVDEYQDINEVQDAILSLLSRECVAGQPGTVSNLFCVGDVKQSIYRFRLAEMAQFLKKREAYLAVGTHGQVIDLQQNFRSRPPLLEAINGLFERLMTKAAADLDYDESQRLKPGLEFPADAGGAGFSGAPIELHLLPKSVGSTGTEEGTEAELDRSQREAVLIGRRILQLVGRAGDPPTNVVDRAGGQATPRPARFGDCVLLLRSMRFKADTFAATLRSMGVPVHADSATGYFEATEVNDVLSLLRVLDNGRQDVPLAAFLRSPLASLPDPEDNLARIRLAAEGEPTVPFHAAVQAYLTRGDELAAHLKDLFARLAHWRQMSRQRPLAELLWAIFTETGYLAYVAGLPNGEHRQANLIELHDRARQFDSFRRQGLGRFLAFLDKLRTERDLGEASIASEADDVVRIMSVHRSKGLEFPIVLLPDLGKTFNLQDAQGTILLDRQLGLGMQVVDEQRQVRYPSLASTVVQQRLRQQSLAEELRVLYVAMTRAKEHLILAGTAMENAAEKWRERWSAHAGPIPAEAVLAARTPMDWLGAAAVAAGPGVVAIDVHAADEVAAWSAEQARLPVLSEDQIALAELKPFQPAPARSDVADRIIADLTTQYAFEAFTHVRASASVTSRVKATAAAEPARGHGVPPRDRVLDNPLFVAERSPLNAADRGTATHLVLEHLTFDEAADAGAIAAQVARLVASRRLTPTQAAAVDVPALEWVVNGEVGDLMRAHAGGVRREVPIYLAQPSTVAASDDPMDRVMIRGRIDTLVATPAGWVVLDYKTDRVDGEGIEARERVYAEQVRLYAEAVTRITGQAVVEVMLVFLFPRIVRHVQVA